MLITLVDDSIPFSGESPAVDPLGGAEKAFASLPAAIARRGHVVRAINRTPAAAALDNVSWLPWNGYRPAITEILIAYRKPSLLDFVRATKRKIFWFTQPADFLLKAPVDQMISRAEPQLVFLGRTHRKSYGAEPPAFAKDIPFGVGAEFLECEPMAPLNPPTAIVTRYIGR